VPKLTMSCGASGEDAVMLPPGPRLPAAVQLAGFWTRPLAFLERCRRRYGTPFTLRLPGTPPFVMLASPEDVKAVFTAPADVLHPGEGARVLEPVVGRHSVILLDGDAHLEQRKLMLPAFHGERMERLERLVEDVTEREVAGWPAGSSVPLHPRLQRLTLEVILRAVFGLEAGPRLDALRDRLAAMLQFGERLVSLVPPEPGSRLDRALQRVGPFARFARDQREADALILELVAERRRAGDESGDDVLSMLLAARHEGSAEPMSSQELRDELMTLLVAGHETTASALAWAFERLAAQPDVLGRLGAEIDAGEDDAYLTATIQETLRRRPVLPSAAPRLVKRALEVGGRRYEPGVALVPSVYLLHHDSSLYPDPYAFRPERFLETPPGTYTWIPFGGGRRRCLGAGFATLEMRVVLRAVLSRYELQPGGRELARRRNITISPGQGAVAALRERPAVAA
jgi:cytochrome P450